MTKYYKSQNLILTNNKASITLELIITSAHLLKKNDSYSPYSGVGKIK